MNRSFSFIPLVLAVVSCQPSNNRSIVEIPNETPKLIWRKAEIQNGAVDVVHGSLYLFPEGKHPGSIKEYLEIYNENELDSITSFDMTSFNLSSLIGLSMLKKLDQMNLSFNQISIIDIDEIPLSIRVINMIDNGIEVVPNFSIFHNLQSLDLSKNKITDISPLGECKNLLGVSLDSNPVLDISVLLELPNLKYAYLLIPNLMGTNAYLQVVKELRGKGVVVYPE